MRPNPVLDAYTYCMYLANQARHWDVIHGQFLNGVLRVRIQDFHLLDRSAYNKLFLCPTFYL